MSGGGGGRFALKPGLIHVAVDDGTYFELGARNFLIRNAKLYPVIHRIVEAMSRGSAPDEVRRALPPTVHRLFDELLVQLRHNRMVTTAPPLSFAAGSGAFRETLLYLQEVTSDAWAAYDAWTRSPIALCGPEQVADDVAVHLARSGATNLILLGGAPDGRADRLRGRIAPDVGSATVHILHAAVHSELSGDTQTPTLLIHIAVPRECDALRAQNEDLASAYDVVVYGGIGPAVALVGPSAKAGLGDGPALLALAPAEPPLTPSAITAAAALIAFEALRVRAAPWMDEPDALLQAANRFLLLGNDLRPRSHDARLALANGRLPPVRDSTPHWQPEALIAETQPLFDDHVLAWAPVRGPEYPLAHRSVTVAAAVDHKERMEVVAWGVDFAAAEANVIAQAVAILAERAESRTVPEEGWGSFVADPDEARARSAACAHALAPQARPIPLCPQSAVDNDLRMLLRLARLYHGSLPELWGARMDDGAGVGWARIGKQVCAGVGTSLEDALTDALGDLLSSMQCGAQPSRQQRPLVASLAKSPLSNDPVVPLTQIQAPPTASATEIDMRDTWRPFAFALARARLRR